MVVVVCALFPGLINTVALGMMAPRIAADLGAPAAFVAAIPLAADAALAFGSVLSAELTRRVDGRTIFLALLAVSTLTACVEAAARAPAVFAAALLVHALAAGMLLIVALPPLVTTFGAGRLPPTAGILVTALFGSVTLGPLVGALLSGGSAWRMAFAGDAALAALALAVAALAIAPRPPGAPRPPVDPWALGASLAATLLTFGGLFFLERAAWSPAEALTAGAALVLYGLLVFAEDRRRDALIPVRALARSLALAGSCATVVGNACYAATMNATAVALAHAGYAVGTIGFALAPGIAGALVGALLFARLVRTRWVVVLAVPGLGCTALAAALALLLPVSPASAGVVAGIAALGGATTIVPGLFLIALSFERVLVGRAIALLNLLRLTGGFLAAPLVAHELFAARAGGIARVDAAVVTVALAGIAAIVAVLARAHLPLRDPDLAAFDAGAAALPSR